MKILLLVDLQNDFIDGSLGSEAALAILAPLKKRLDLAKEAGEKIIFTRDSHDSNYLKTQEGRKLPILHCQTGTEGHKLHPAIAPTQAAYVQENATDLYQTIKDNPITVVDKGYFASRPLAEAIAKLTLETEISEIEILGICTDICVLSNAFALKSYLPEMKISINSNCSATGSPALHEAALAVLASCQFDIIR